MYAPKQSHFSVALKVLKYLKGDPARGIEFFRNSELCLRAFFDSDWATCPISRKSVTGYCVCVCVCFFSNSFISYKSKKQSTVSRSFAEAEYRAITQTCYEITWIIGLFKDLQICDLLFVSLSCDNSAAIQIAANPVFHERTKHIEIYCHFVRDNLTKGIICTKVVRYEDQCVNLLPRHLTANLFPNCVLSLVYFHIFQVQHANQHEEGC